MYNFVNQMVIDDKTYTAYRNSENPRQCKIVCGEEEIAVERLKDVWSKDTVPTLFNGS